MNYALIESFCALAQRLNFTKAAADLFITQPTLSRNIVMLENELGFQLFHRSKHSVQLTELGGRFLPYAQEIKKSNDAAVSFAAHIAKNARSAIIKEIRIGVATLQFTRFLPSFISYMSSEMPELRFSVTDGLQQDVFQQLRDNQLDIIFTAGSSLGDRRGLETLLLRRSSMKLVVAASHPLAASVGPVPLRSLKDCDLPFISVDTTVQSRMTQMLPELEVKQMRAPTQALTMVASGLGIAICHEGVRSIAPPNVVFLDLEGDPFQMDAVIAWNKEPSPAAWREKFIQQMQTFVDKYSGLD